MWTARDERPLSSVPAIAWTLLGLALAAQVVFTHSHPRQPPRAADLGRPPARLVVSALSLGDPLTVAKLMNLVLQAHDNQPGISLPLASLDYGRVIAWLDRILDIDPAGPYPLTAASRLYAEVPDQARARQMLEFVHERFHAAPNLRWPALAHAAHVARHQLKDLVLARQFAASLAREANGPAVPAWARQMEILLVADMNEKQSARVLLGALLESGQIRDEAEYRFLAGRIETGATTIASPSK
jgi:hypothetical protein